MWNWLSPVRLWNEIRRNAEGHHAAARGFAMGVFIANTPLWGLHTVMCLAAARLFRLHPLTVTAGSGIGATPIGPALIALAIAVGHYLIHGTWPSKELLRIPAEGHRWPWFLEVVEEWCIGSVIIGFATAVAAYVIVYAALRLVPVRRDPLP